MLNTEIKAIFFNFLFLFTSIIRSTIVSHCSGRLVRCTVSHKEQLALRDRFQLTDIFHVKFDLARRKKHFYPR